MYEEGHSNFAIKDVILRLLFIILVIFLIIWLFPTKNYVKNIIDQKLGTGSSQVFNTNIEIMKNAALSYYSGDRLPSKEGSSKTITLEEMLDKKLLVDFTDSNGKKCDYQKSYATVTKNKSDYSLKVNLACSDKKDYINSYIGSYDYCTGDVCEKKKLTDSSSDNSNTETAKSGDKQSTDVSKKESSVSNSKDNAKTKECEYVKSSQSYWSNYGSWSSWSTNAAFASNSRQVETKTEKVQVGSITEKSGTTKQTQSPKKVTLVKNGKQYVVYVCPSDFDNGGSYDNYVTCVKTVVNYVTKPTYKNVVYYRYRDRQYINGKSSYKWSSCDDSALIKDGYSATGNVR